MQQCNIERDTMNDTRASNGNVIAYYRVSTNEQHTENQAAAIEKAGYAITKAFSDKGESGTKAAIERKGLSELLSYVREGDTVVVYALDRLGRNTADVLNTIDTLTKRGARLVILQQQFDTATPAGKLALTMFAAFAEFEHGLRKERQREGIERARKQGKYQGRKPKLTASQKAALLERIAAGENKSALAREYGIDRVTVYRIGKDQENDRE